MREVTYKETLSVIERLYKLTEQKYGETNDSRFLALYDLARKMRACMNAVILLPHEEYEMLCVPINPITSRTFMRGITTRRVDLSYLG